MVYNVPLQKVRQTLTIDLKSIMTVYQITVLINAMFLQIFLHVFF